ncbi:MAG: site-specific DNA-methyltransferase [Melioribacteraceae bacterium]|nr:site-specific DNA-methyltransferase [Melioribacteraceae bacterium]MCO6474567.1 site-specific DNA-methyltransferase [Melioribacteraceae bacterium]MDD3558154.1 site-specific DNA-methyltransferase [Melioribacteraceae bacterium]
MIKNQKAERNKTITLTPEEQKFYSGSLLNINQNLTVDELTNKIINNDLFEILDFLPDDFIDLLIIDPPYNLYKSFNKTTFKKTSNENYGIWIESFLHKLKRCMREDASIYFCGDWISSQIIPSVLEKYFILKNRITWEREKGRGAKRNWKNCSEDIWFAVNSESYKFNPDSVKLKRKVLAPYRDYNGQPKDWIEESDGSFRLTFPSNLWTDISVPFWSMPENTEHPTQKPEKLIAKLILASTDENDLVFDPFLGSGTTAVVAKKLNRKFSGVELDKHYALLAQKRLKIAETETSIQGYKDGVFWERNTKLKRQ